MRTLMTWLTWIYFPSKSYDKTSFWPTKWANPVEVIQTDKKMEPIWASRMWEGVLKMCSICRISGNCSKYSNLRKRSPGGKRDKGVCFGLVLVWSNLIDFSAKRHNIYRSSCDPCRCQTKQDQWWSGPQLSTLPTKTRTCQNWQETENTIVRTVEMTKNHKESHFFHKTPMKEERILSCVKFCLFVPQLSRAKRAEYNRKPCVRSENGELGVLMLQKTKQGFSFSKLAISNTNQSLFTCAQKKRKRLV